MSFKRDENVKLIFSEKSTMIKTKIFLILSNLKWAFLKYLNNPFIKLFFSWRPECTTSRMKWVRPWRTVSPSWETLCSQTASSGLSEHSRMYTLPGTNTDVYIIIIIICKIKLIDNIYRILYFIYIYIFSFSLEHFLFFIKIGYIHVLFIYVYVRYSWSNGWTKLADFLGGT